MLSTGHVCGALQVVDNALGFFDDPRDTCCFRLCNAIPLLRCLFGPFLPSDPADQALPSRHQRRAARLRAGAGTHRSHAERATASSAASLTSAPMAEHMHSGPLGQSFDMQEHRARRHRSGHHHHRHNHNHHNHDHAEQQREEERQDAEAEYASAAAAADVDDDDSDLRPSFEGTEGVERRTATTRVYEPIPR